LIETEELQEIYCLIVGGAPKEGTRPNRFEEDLERAEKFWKEMFKWKFKNAAVVCHGNLIRFFLSKAIGAPPNYFNNMKIDPASVSIINIKKDKSRIVLVNDVVHIPKELLSNNSVYLE
jgi:broad specificity phosphatase PhoE